MTTLMQRYGIGKTAVYRYLVHTPVLTREESYRLFHMTLHSSCGWGSLRWSSESARSS